MIAKIVFFTVVLVFISMASAGAAEACGCDSIDAWEFDALSDHTKWQVAEACGLPEAPEGYYWIMDDLSLKAYSPSGV